MFEQRMRKNRKTQNVTRDNTSANNSLYDILYKNQ